MSLSKSKLVIAHFQSKGLHDQFEELLKPFENTVLQFSSNKRCYYCQNLYDADVQSCIRKGKYFCSVECAELQTTQESRIKESEYDDKEGYVTSIMGEEN